MIIIFLSSYNALAIYIKLSNAKNAFTVIILLLLYFNTNIILFIVMQCFRDILKYAMPKMLTLK